MNIVYKATHKPTGKFYIGRTDRELSIRIDEHWNTIEHRAYYFQDFLRDTNSADWHWEILHTLVSLQDAKDCEMYYINTLDAYNIGLNRKGGLKSEEDKKTASDRMKAYRAANPEPWHKGRTGVYSEESLAKMRLAKQKNPVRAYWTEERKLQASKQFGKRIKELTSGLVFDSISKAAAHFNLRREAVRDVVNGKRKTTAGLVFVVTD